MKIEYTKLIYYITKGDIKVFREEVSHIWQGRTLRRVIWFQENKEGTYISIDDKSREAVLEAEFNSIH